MLVLLSFLALLFFLSTGNRGFYQQVKIRRQRVRLKQEIAFLKSRIEELEAERQRLQEPAEIERIAREEYGMAKKDEKVYRVVPKEE